MKIWRMLAAAPVILLASRALAENWVALGSMGEGTSVDKDSIRRGSDGLVYFTDRMDQGERGGSIDEDLAMDCQRRLIYVLKFNREEAAGDWRDRSRAIEPNSSDDAELQYVCANAG